jgi:hypothetical protein
MKTLRVLSFMGYPLLGFLLGSAGVRYDSFHFWAILITTAIIEELSMRSEKRQ